MEFDHYFNSENRRLEFESRSSFAYNSGREDSKILIKRRPGRPPKTKPFPTGISDQLQDSVFNCRKKESRDEKDIRDNIKLSDFSSSENKTEPMEFAKTLQWRNKSCIEVSEFLKQKVSQELVKVKRKPGRPPKNLLTSVNANPNAIITAKDSNTALEAVESFNNSAISSFQTYKDLTNNADTTEFPRKRKPGRPSKNLFLNNLKPLQSKNCHDTINSSINKPHLGFFYKRRPGRPPKNISFQDIKEIYKKWTRDEFKVNSAIKSEVNSTNAGADLQIGQIKRKPGRPPKILAKAVLKEICSEDLLRENNGPLQSKKSFRNFDEVFLSDQYGHQKIADSSNSAFCYRKTELYFERSNKEPNFLEEANERSSDQQQCLLDSDAVKIKETINEESFREIKRRRFKKTHGPDFVETSSIPSSDSKDELRCDYCLMTSDANRNGDPEDLLVCKDCNAKAHPTCMEYSPELAIRSRMSPWQCIDCKTCSICDDSGDGDCMLFCDLCDKGYHMSCHIPKVTTKPIGKWACNYCSKDPRAATNGYIRSTGMDYHNSNQRAALDAATGLPTPCDSPISEDMKKDYYGITNGTWIFEECLSKYPKIVPDAQYWSIENVEKFFITIGFAEQAPAFKDQEIDGKSLLLMKRSDVLTGLSLKLGPALKIYNHVKRLQTRHPDGHLLEC